MLDLSKEINNDIFILDGSMYNPEGLLNYTKKIEENLGVKTDFIKNMKSFDLDAAALCDTNLNKIYLLEHYIRDGLSEKEYRAVKGLIDHEIGHLFWNDRSYLKYRSGYYNKEKGKSAFYLISALIDDIKVERYMINKFSVDKFNFKYAAEVFIYNEAAFPEAGLEDIFCKDMQILNYLINERYRKIEIPHIKNRALISSATYQNFMDLFVPYIDLFLLFNEKAVETVRRILNKMEKKNV